MDAIVVISGADGISSSANSITRELKRKESHQVDSVLRFDRIVFLNGRLEL